MAKIALLIGVSDHQPGFDPLPGTQTDIRAMQRVLQHSQMGGFDQVDLLPNPDKGEMELAIEKLLADRQRDDLVLLYFSGHGFKDDDGSLYFVTHTTKQRPPHQIYQSTAVPASVLQGWMSRSRCKRQVLVLDCCFSGAFAEGMKAKAVNETVDINAQFGGEGRAVLTSSTATQVSFEQQEAAVYTRYLVEGIESGAADTDSNGVITVDELHEYAKRKVQEAAPAMKPEIFAVKEGYKIVLAQAPLGDPKLEYRKEVEQLAQQRNGLLSPIVLRALDEKRRSLGLLPEEVGVIQNEVLRPYRELEEKLQRYEQALTEALQQESLLNEETCEDLEYFQQALGLRDEDVELIYQQIVQVETPLQVAVELSEVSERMARVIKILEEAESHLETHEELDSYQLPPLEQPLTQRLSDVSAHPLPKNTGLLDSARLLAVGIVLLFSALLILSNLHYSKLDSVSRPSGSIAPNLTPPDDSSTLKPTENPSTSKSLDFETHSFAPTNKSAIEFVNESAIVSYNKALEEEKQGNKREAIADYTQAIQFDPNYADAYYSRGNIRKAVGEKQGAIQDYQKAASLYQQEGEVGNYQNALNRIKVLQK